MEQDDREMHLAGIIDQQIVACERLMAINERARSIIPLGRSADLQRLLTEQESLLQGLRVLQQKAQDAGVQRRQEKAASRCVEEMEARLRVLAAHIRDLGDSNRGLLALHALATDAKLRFLVPLLQRGGGYVQSGEASRAVEPQSVYHAKA